MSGNVGDFKNDKFPKLNPANHRVRKALLFQWSLIRPSPMVAKLLAPMLSKSASFPF